MFSSSTQNKERPCNTPIQPSRRLRRRTASCLFLLALLFTAWLPLGLVNALPFIFEWPGESSLRLHAAAAVGCLMLAALTYSEL
jgi:hypothetical protein